MVSDDHPDLLHILNHVLILVVMEYGLRLGTRLKLVLIGLNPCCNGIWSQTVPVVAYTVLVVLILVVMEYGLRLE